MKNLYLFLDIDGVLYDWDYIIAEVNAGRMKRGAFIRKFKPESMKALNYLIEELQKRYFVQLVISSTWRGNLEFTTKTLKENGLQYNLDLHATPITDPIERGKQILMYLSDKTNYDFLIIDDENFDFNKYFNPNKIIKTEMFHNALSLKQVKRYLDVFIDLSK